MTQPPNDLFQNLICTTLSDFRATPNLLTECLFMMFMDSYRLPAMHSQGRRTGASTSTLARSQTTKQNITGISGNPEILEGIQALG